MSEGASDMPWGGREMNAAGQRRGEERGRKEGCYEGRERRGGNGVNVRGLH